MSSSIRNRKNNKGDDQDTGVQDNTDDTQKESTETNKNGQDVATTQKGKGGGDLLKDNFADLKEPPLLPHLSREEARQRVIELLDKDKNPDTPDLTREEKFELVARYQQLKKQSEGSRGGGMRMSTKLDLLFLFVWALAFYYVVFHYYGFTWDEIKDAFGGRGQ